MSTIFLTALNTHDNIANIVMKSSWEAAKTLQLNSHETSLSKVKTAGSQYLCGFPFFVLAEYSCAVTPQVRQTGNRLSGLAGTAYASLLT